MLAAVASVGLAVATAPPVQASTTPVVEPQVISDDSLSARSTVMDGGAKVLPTTRTVAHWNGHTTDMPAFKSKLTKDEVWSLVEYLKTLRTPAKQ